MKFGGTKVCVALLVSLGLLAANAKLTVYLTGNAGDVTVSPAPGGPVYDLGGGDWDVIDAFQDTIDKVRGCTGPTCATKIDIVILRASGGNGYNDYLYAFNGVDSVQTFVITAVRDITTAVETAIKNAEFIFFAGGDQCLYTTLFKGTLVETAVEYAQARGAAIGGTSAGEAIMGPYVYDSCATSTGTTSSQALANPYDKTITFTYNFFNFTNMHHTITDQHFVARDRMGRLLSFMARLIKDGMTDGHVWGVAVNEETSIVVDKLGMGTVVQNYGGNPLDPEIIAPSLNPVAYYILADHQPTTCVNRAPLTYMGYKVWKRTTGQTFNFKTRPTTAPDYTLDVINGVIYATGNSGSIY